MLSKFNNLLKILYKHRRPNDTQHQHDLEIVSSEKIASLFQINFVLALNLHFIDKNFVYSHCLVIYEIWPIRHSIMKTKSPIDESLISFSAS